MTDKLKGYTAEEISEEEQAERLETAAELAPDPEVVVPTGDEDSPVSAPVHTNALKSLYDKGRKHRDLTQREDAEATADVDKIQRMVAEAAGGDTNAADQLDTNRDMDDDERKAAARIMQEGFDEAAAKKDEEEIVNEEEPEAPDSLPPAAPDAKVNVKILGKQYEVPQQDVDDAGGLELYQKSRAANVKLQRAATLEQRAFKALEEAQAAHEEQPQADPPSDGQGEADIDSLRDELMDTVIEGTEDDINKWIEKVTTRTTTASTPETPPPPTPAVVTPAAQTETQEELQAQFEDDRKETNAMMQSQYRDIMKDPELTSLAQQRFELLRTRADSEGRTQKEMARESAEYVLSMAKRVLGDQPTGVSKEEQERQTRVERKRRMPQPSQADAIAPDTSRKHETKVPTRREHFERLRRRAGHDLTLD